MLNVAWDQIFSTFFTLSPKRGEKNHATTSLQLSSLDLSGLLRKDYELVFASGISNPQTTLIVQNDKDDWVAVIGDVFLGHPATTAL